MYAKKSLGQHFLKSEKALRTIVEVGNIKDTDVVLEIGPGTGTLTERLLPLAHKVIAVEKDDALSAELRVRFPTLELVHGDILDFAPPEGPYKLIANIPYNITGAILEKFLSAEYQPERMVLLVQKEVAERIVPTSPRLRGTRAKKKESILSISVKAYGQPRYVETVKAGSFVPAPRVDSAILAIEGISKRFFSDPRHGGASFSEKSFFELLKTGFSSKRKKLSSNLANKFERNDVINAFETLAFDENTRAEDVGIGDWGRLAGILCV